MSCFFQPKCISLVNISKTLYTNTSVIKNILQMQQDGILSLNCCLNSQNLSVICFQIHLSHLPHCHTFLYSYCNSLRYRSNFFVRVCEIPLGNGPACDSYEASSALLKTYCSVNTNTCLKFECVAVEAPYLFNDFLRWRSNCLRTLTKPARARARVLGMNYLDTLPFT